MFTFNGEVRARYEVPQQLPSISRDNDSNWQLRLNDDQMGFTLTGSWSESRATSRRTSLRTSTSSTPVTSATNSTHRRTIPFFCPIGLRSDRPTPPTSSRPKASELYQGYVEIGKIGGSDFSAVRPLAPEHTYGTELFLGDNDYYNGLSFDGVRGMWQHGQQRPERLLLHRSPKRTAASTASPATDSGPGASADSNLWGATLRLEVQEVGTARRLRPHRPGISAATDRQDSSRIPRCTTYGARWNRGMMTDDKLNMFDWNIEVRHADRRHRRAVSAVARRSIFRPGSSRDGSRSTTRSATSRPRPHRDAYDVRSGRPASTDAEDFITLLRRLPREQPLRRPGLG